MKRKAFRVGMRVQVASDPMHTFVIDKSLVPPRIYREKGANRWWLADELQRLGAPEDPARSTRLNGRVECARAELPLRECRRCHIVFQPARKWQRFCSTPCRLEHWKRTKTVDVLTPGTAVA